VTSVEDLRTLYDYGYWANQKIFDVLSQLTPDEFTREVSGGCGSVRNTLVHMMSAEWGWLDRCGGAKRGPALAAADYPTVASVMDRWRQVEAYVREFLSTLRDDDLNVQREFSFGGPTFSMRLCELMQHAANHSVHHRGQVALLLRSLGHAPGNFDILFYYGQSQAVALRAR
jgi:uncharacterized damage-inducible protein DinB